MVKPLKKSRKVEKLFESEKQAIYGRQERFLKNKPKNKFFER